MRILIVEDEFKIADVVANRLWKEQYVVDVFTNGEDGLDNALTNIYELIILDVMLPKVNGFEILEEIRREKITAKVIMLTAKTIYCRCVTWIKNTNSCNYGKCWSSRKWTRWTKMDRQH